MDDDKLKQSDEEKPVSPESEAVSENQPKPEEEAPESEVKTEEETTKQKAPEAAEGEKTEVTEPAAETATEEEKPSEVEKSEEKPVKKPSEEKKEEKPSKKDEKAPPQKIGKEKGKRKSNAKFLVTIGLSLAGLFVAFIVLMVIMISVGGAESPILASIGLNASSIKGFLIAVVNLSFGLLALLFFVLTVVGVFRLLFAKKGDKEAKGKGIKMFLVGVIPLFTVMFVWLFLFNYIGGIEIAAERIKAEIVIVQPTELTGLKAPLEITFSSENVIKSLQNSGLNISGARWDFDGDGVFESVPTDFEISYLYNLRGTYNVGFEVTINGESEPRRFFYSLSIEEALFDAKPSSGTAPLLVQFDASSLIPGRTKVQSLDWDFDEDGVYDLTGKDNLRPRYTFEQIGVYRVHLRIVDENNLVNNYYREIEIIIGDRPLLSAAIEASPGLSGTIPLQIRFDGGKSDSVKGQIVRYEWDFGEGAQVQVGRSVSHVYNNPGFYTVTLKIVEDSGKEATTTVEVEAGTISSAPEARLTTKPVVNADGVIEGELPLKISFDASTSVDDDDDIVDYEWDFGFDGATQIGQKVEFTFDRAGSYTVTLLVRDSKNLESSATLSVVVEEPGVRSVITSDFDEGTAPLVVSFDGSSSSSFKGKIVSYEWDFGDGTPPTITSAQVTHKYSNVGSYSVRLKVVTNQNESATSEKVINVREIPLRACFEPSRRDGEAPLPVTFDTKCSTGAVSTYTWDFGDGKTSTSRKPTHTFENPGTYNVTLEVSDGKSNVSVFSDVVVAQGTLE